MGNRSTRRMRRYGTIMALGLMTAASWLAKALRLNCSRSRSVR